MMKQLNTKTYDDFMEQHRLRMTETGLKSALKLESPLRRNRSSNLSKTHRDEASPYLRLNTDLNSTKFSSKMKLNKGGTIKKVRHLDSPEFID